MKGIDIAIKKTAGQLNLPEDQVKTVVMEYWNSIYKKLLRLESTTITIRHVGNLNISKYKLNNYISKLIGKIRRVRNSKNLSKEKRDEILQEEGKKLTIALARRNDIAIMFKEVKDTRKKAKKK